MRVALGDDPREIVVAPGTSANGSRAVFCSCRSNGSFRRRTLSALPWIALIGRWKKTVIAYPGCGSLVILANSPRFWTTCTIRIPRKVEAPSARFVELLAGMGSPALSWKRWRNRER